LAIVHTACLRYLTNRAQQRENTVIVFGVILLIIGFIAKIEPPAA